MFKNELSQNRYREKLRRSLISQLESQKTNIEPFLDNVDRYISLWETAISLEKIYPRTASDWRMVKRMNQ